MASPVPAFTACLSLHASGKLEAAEQCYRTLLDNRPGHAESLHHLGIIALQTDRLTDAEPLLRAARAASPNNGAVLANLAFVLLRLGRLEETLECCEEVALATSAPAELFNIRGMALAQLARFDEALSSFETAIAVKPTFVDAHLNRGLALKTLGNADGAAETFRTAITIDPHSFKGFGNLGNAQRALGEVQDALRSYDHALSLNPHFEEAQTNRFLTLLDIGDTAEALRSVLRLRADYPTNIRFEYLFGLCLAQTGRNQAAIEAFQKVRRAEIDNFDAIYGIARSYSEMGDPDQALHYFDLALSLRSESLEATFGKSLMILQAGDLENGLRGFEARKLIDGEMGIKSLAGPIWDGVQELRGRKILVHEEQGFGDIFNFSRFIPTLESRGAHVTFAVKKRLHDVLSKLSPTVQLVEPDVAGEFDFGISLMSLPLALGLSKNTIPKVGRYLAPTVEASNRWRRRLKAVPRPRIGVVWRSNMLNTAMAKRNIPFGLFSQMMRPGFSWVSLQVEASGAEKAFFSAHDHLYDFTAEIGSFDDTAAIMDELDLVISVDTGAAHLAGALAVNTWILLCKSADWRWFLTDPDCLWYDSVHLIRQSSLGDWSTVLANVDSKLDELF